MEKRRERDGRIMPLRSGTLRLPMWPEEIEGFLDRVMGSFVRWPGNFSLPDEWVPSIDIIEQNGHVVVRADLPGMKREDIEVTVEGDKLVIRGHRHEEADLEDKDYRRTERATGDFYRAVNLAEGVDPKSIEATYSDGVLEVKVPRPATQEPKKFKVTVK